MTQMNLLRNDDRERELEQLLLNKPQLTGVDWADLLTLEKRLIGQFYNKAMKEAFSITGVRTGRTYSQHKKSSIFNVHPSANTRLTRGIMIQQVFTITPEGNENESVKFAPRFGKGSIADQLFKAGNLSKLF